MTHPHNSRVAKRPFRNAQFATRLHSSQAIEGPCLTDHALPVGGAVRAASLPLSPQALLRMCQEFARRQLPLPEATFDWSEIASTAAAELVASEAFRAIPPGDDSRARRVVWTSVRFAKLRLLRRQKRIHESEEGFARMLPDGVSPTVLESIELLQILNAVGRKHAKCPKSLVLRIAHGIPYGDLAVILRTKTVDSAKMFVVRCLKKAYAIAKRLR